MGIRFVITTEAAPGKLEELKANSASMGAECEEEPGCEQYEFFQSMKNPNRLVLLSRWTDQESQDIHRTHNHGYNNPSLRAGPGQVERYDY